MDNETQSAHPTQQHPAPSASAASTPPAAAADDARAQQHARRSQLRDEAERDPFEQECRRLESIAAKATAREACRAAALAAQSAEWRSFGPAQRLFTDGIALCLSCLDLKGVVKAARTCKSWRVGAHAVQSLGTTQTLDATSVGRRLSSIPASPFRKLITALALSSRFPPLALVDLHALVNLRSISLILTPAMFEGAMIVFPPQLESAQLNFGRCSQPESEGTLDASFLMRGLQPCASLTRLELRSVGIDLDLTAVAGLQQLRELSIEAWTRLSAGLVSAIKTLPLRSLTLRPLLVKDYLHALWDRALDPLLTLPHALQSSLQSFQCHNAGGWSIARLVSFSSLTELLPTSVHESELPHLAPFSQLRSLRLRFTSAYVAGAHVLPRAAAFLHRIAHCSLTDLALIRTSFEEGDIAALCAAQPLLQRLSLEDVRVTDLSGLETLRQLRDFRLDLALATVQTQSPLWINQLSRCASLQTLALSNVHECALSAADRAALTPPSAALPLLITFACRSPHRVVGTSITL